VEFARSVGEALLDRVTRDKMVHVDEDPPRLTLGVGLDGGETQRHRP
jgi:hypothetical protein